MSLQEFQPKELSGTKDNAVSIYKQGKVSAEAFAHGTKKIQDAFPKLPATWFKLLDQMIDEEGFSEEKFRDAVNSLIKNCVYPEPAIANLLSYDKTVKTYTYSELQSKHKDAYYMGATYDPMVQEYTKINVCGQLRYAKNEDAIKYNLQKWA